jgi:competence protein ComEC
MLLIYLALAFMGGIVIADLFALTAPTLWVACGIAPAAAALLRRNRLARTLSLCLCCAALGALRLTAANIPPPADDIRHLVGNDELVVEGLISNDPKRNDDGQQLIVQVTAAKGAVVQPASGQLLVIVPPFPAYRYGQRVIVTGALQIPRGATRPGEFDYQAYLARKGIFVLMRQPYLRVIGDNEGLPLLRWLYTARDRCRTILLRELPEPQASLAVGILLGLQSSIPDEVYAAFSATGTSHILVVSGWNFTIVAAVLAGLTERLRLGKGATLWSSLAVMWLYALFVGATAAVLRSAAMASIMVLARTTERRSEPWTLLAVACWGMCILDPNTLWDLGFQLSALATASLFAFAKPVEAWVKKVPLLGHPTMAPFAEALNATLAAQVLTLPIILYNFGNMSFIAPLANVLLVPVVPYAMLFGTIALVGGLIWLPLGQWLALLVWLPLSWLAEGARILASLPWAASQIPPFPLSILLCYYVAVICGWLAALFTAKSPEGDDPQ